MQQSLGWTCVSLPLSVVLNATGCSLVLKPEGCYDLKFLPDGPRLLFKFTTLIRLAAVALRA